MAKTETIKHVHELLELMIVLTADRRFVEVCSVMVKEAVNMCKVLDQIENRGMEKDRPFLEELIQELLPEER